MQTVKKGKSRLLIAVVLSVVIVGIVGFGSGIAYQASTATAQSPPVTTPTPRPTVISRIGIFPTYLNVSLWNIGNSHAIGTLKVSLLDSSSSALWTANHDYDLAPSIEQAFIFYPTINPNNAASIQVQP